MAIKSSNHRTYVQSAEDLGAHHLPTVSVVLGESQTKRTFYTNLNIRPFRNETVVLRMKYTQVEGGLRYSQVRLWEVGLNCSYSRHGCRIVNAVPTTLNPMQIAHSHPANFSCSSHFLIHGSFFLLSQDLSSMLRHIQYELYAI